MAKLNRLTLGCMALVAFLIVGAPAFAGEKHDPDCEQEGPPPQGPFEVFEFDVDTPDSSREHAVSGATFAWLACSSSIQDGAPQDLSDFAGKDLLYKFGVIDSAPGVTVNPTVGPGSQLADGDYVGHAEIDVLSWVIWQQRNAALFIDAVAMAPIVMRVDDAAGTDCQAYATKPLIACYKWVEDWLLVDGHGWVWVEDVGGGRTRTTIGLPYNDTYLAARAGITQIDSFALCKYAGTATDTSCGGNSRPWVQKNGDKSTTRPGNCLGGKGVYTVTVTNWAGLTTAPARSCVLWTPKVYR